MDASKETRIGPSDPQHDADTSPPQLEPTIQEASPLNQQTPPAHTETIAGTGSGSTDQPKTSPEIAHPPRDVHELADLLHASRLMSPDEVQIFLEHSFGPDAAPPTDDVIEALIKKNKLTEYQAEMLRAGKPSGLVLGNYVVEKKIGAGGMGVVFKARHRRMKRTVAIKVLPEGLTNSPDALARFHREVEAAAKLQHPNIAAAYDADDSDGIHFLVMELVDGPDLSAYVKEHGPLPLPHALALCVQTAAGLSHAHAKGVVHRDIKPGNLLVDSGGVLKILDMGLAQLSSEADDAPQTELTQSGRIMGTVDYLAPEQAIDAKRADHRADIYGLGCTLFYLVMGRPVAPDGSLTEKLLWHQSKEIPPLSKSCPAATEALDGVYRKMLGKKPDDRQESMAEVAEQLQTCRAEIVQKEKVDVSKLHGPLARVTLTGSANGPVSTERPTLRGLRGMGKADKKRSVAGPLVATAVVIAILVGGAAAMGLFGPGEDDSDPNNANSVVIDGGDKPDNGGEQIAKVDSPPAKPQRDPQVVKLLKWAFANGGSAMLVTADGPISQPVTALSEVPEGHFEVQSLKLDSTSVQDSELERLKTLTGLEAVSLDWTGISDAGVAQLATMPELRSLNLSRTKITDAGLASIAKLSQLRELNLGRTAITDAGLAQLKGLAHLKKLYLSDTRVTDKGLESIRSLASLRYISLNGNEITVAARHSLKKIRPKLTIDWTGPDSERLIARKLIEVGAKIHLASARGSDPEAVTRTVDLPAGHFWITEVDASGIPSFGDAEIEEIATLGQLALLHLDGTGVSDEGLDLLQKSAALRELNLGALQLSDARVDALKRALSECKISRDPTNQRATATWVVKEGGTVSVVAADGTTTDHIEVAEELPRGTFFLRSAQLADVELSDDDLVRFRGLAQLESLDLSGTKASDAGMEYLVGSPQLVQLNLAGTGVTDSGIRLLARIKTLEKLYLSRTAVTAEGLKALIRLPKLTDLSVSHTGLGDDDLTHLKGIQSLQWLALSGTKITDGSINALGQLATLQELFVEKTALTDAGVEELAAALPDAKIRADAPDPQRLATRWALDLGGTVEVNEREISRLADLPRDACSISKIDLSELPDVGREDLSLLVPCVTIEHLFLEGTGIGNESLAHLSGLTGLERLSLAGNPKITAAGITYLEPLTPMRLLDLSETRISEDSLARLQGMSNLRDLRLNNCRLTDRSLEAIKGHTSLLSLKIAANSRISDDGAAHLTELANLQRLDLSGTRVTDACLDSLLELKKLRILTLSSTDLTDAGVARLAELVSLEELRLQGVKISDAALTPLGELEKLTYLDVTGTRVTAEAAQQMREAKPDLRLHDSGRKRSERDANQAGAGGSLGR